MSRFFIQRAQTARKTAGPAWRHKSALLAALLAASATCAQAADGTWTGGSGAEYTTAANWNPAAVPDGTATFTNNGAPTAVTISSYPPTLGTMLFTAGAPAYTFTITNPGPTTGGLPLVGAGIVNNSSNKPTFNVGAGTGMSLNGSSTSAANAVINNSGTVSLATTSTAGTATITNDNGGQTGFWQGSTAASATIINNAGQTQFMDDATAGSATIANNIGGSTTFSDNSTANAAAITNDGGITYFVGGSSADHATITANAGGSVYFYDTANGVAARLIANAGGTIDFSGLTSTGTTAGSIEGAGTYYLGSKTLTVGSLNTNTIVSGTIDDTGGVAGGTGGSLVKTGTGTLTLSGSNAYSGATTINAGTLALGAGGSIAASNGVTVAAGATFDVSASSQTVAALTNGGTVIVGDAATTTLTVTGNYVGNGGTLSVSGPLTGISPIHIGGTASGSTLVTYTGPSSPPANCGDVLLVQDGSGSSGTFALAGGASARLSVGGCQYRLAQGAAGNWYLESSPFSVGSVPVPTLDRMALALLALLLAIGAAITGMRRY